MKRVFDIIRAHRQTIYALIIAASIVLGLTLALLTYNQSFGTGDPSTFFDFAHNLDHGEIIYKNFIHFRTPGDYFLEASFLRIFGDKISSLYLALYIDTLVFVPVLILISAIVIFIKKRNPFYLLATFAGIALMPPIADSRVGFGILAIAFYYASFELRKHQKLFLFLAGLFTGVTFIFGQEIASMVGIALIAGELFNLHEGGLKLKERLKFLIGGIALGILPLLIYVLFFSNAGTFLYYVFWYSFVIQPKFMDLPFPGFGIVNLTFYLPFLIYWLCFMVAYANRKLGKPAAILLSFAILQLITALGRSDQPHLLFSIPELFIVVPLFLFSIKDAEFNKKWVKDFAPYGALVIILFLLGKVSHSFSIIAIPFVILYAIHTRKTAKNQIVESNQSAINLTLALGSAFAVFIVLLLPVYKIALTNARAGWNTRHDTAYEIEGVKTDPVTYQEITGVEAAVKADNPQSIFSFPINAFFDTLAPRQATRFITFEFETTVTQQNQAIQDLQKNRPGVVVFDPLQAQGLSGVVWKVSDYVTSNYQLQTQVGTRDIYWIMVPQAHPTRDDKLVYQLYHDNTSKTAANYTFGIQTSTTGLNNAVAQANATPVYFNISSPTGSHLDLSLDNQAGVATPTVCGDVVINYSSSSQTVQVCSSEGQIAIPIKATSSNVQLRFENPTGQALIWNNPSITN